MTVCNLSNSAEKGDWTRHPNPPKPDGSKSPCHLRSSIAATCLGISAACHATWRPQLIIPLQGGHHMTRMTGHATYLSEAEMSCAMMSLLRGAMLVSRKRCAASCGAPRLRNWKLSRMGATMTDRFCSPVLPAGPKAAAGSATLRVFALHKYCCT